MKQPLITNIQRYSIHDGDGIRTTVFFKGCNMACRWCHNPETQDFSAEPMRNPDRCSGCGRCAELCPEHAISINDGGISVTDRDKCVRCGECVDECYNEARTISGRAYGIPELIKILEKDYVVELAKRLHSKGYSVYIDTCGFAPYENYEKILPYADVFLYDIKAIDDDVHRSNTRVSNKLILDNLAKLGRAGAKIYIRMPLIAGLNDSEDMLKVIAFLRDNSIPVLQVNLLPYHELGQDKLEKLGKERHDYGFNPPSKQHLNELVQLFNQNGYNNTKIGG